MQKNHVMLMAKFIHAHPELQMQPPRVWRTHYEDECQEKNNTYSFTALKQYSSLVKIQTTGRNNLYGSAKIPAEVLADRSTSQPKIENKKKQNVSAQSDRTPIDRSYESAMEDIQNIMISASKQIQEVLGKIKVR